MSADDEGSGGTASHDSGSLNARRFRLGALGIVRLAYRTVRRQLWAQLGVAAAVLVPLIALLLAALALLPRRDAAIVNGTVAIGPGTSLDLVVLIPLALLLAAAGLLVFAACSAMTAGALVGRPVGWPAALRLARSRLLPLVALVLLLGVVWLAASTVLLSVLAFPLMMLPFIAGGGPDVAGPEGFVGGPGAGPFGSFFGGSFGAFAVSGIGLVLTLALAVFALRFLVALPVVVLERLGTVGAALRYTVAVTRGRVVVTRLALVVGVLVVPELLARGATALAGVLAGGLDLSESSRMLLHDVLEFGIRVGLIPFQVATLTVAFLNGRQPAREGAPPALPSQPAAVEADLDRVAAHLDGEAARVPAPPTDRGPVPWGPLAARGGTPRRRALVAMIVVGVLAALALPGVLSAGSRALNPRGLAVVSDRLLPDRVRAETAEGTLTMSGGLPLAAVRAGGTLSLFVCSDRRCRGSHRVEVADGFVSASMASLRSPAASTTPSAGVVVAGWREVDDGHLELRLLSCTSGGCGAPEQAPLLDQAPADARDRSVVAVAATPDGGLVVADLLAAEPRVGRAPGFGVDGRLRLLFCADPRCADPRAVTVARGADLELTANTDETLPQLPPELVPSLTRPLAVTVSPDGRAAVALATGGDGPIVVATCDTSACAHPATARIPSESAGAAGQGPDAYLQPRHGIDLALPAGQGPLVTFEAPGDAATVLVVCRTPACDSTDRITLASSDEQEMGPFPVGPAAVELDRQGRPELAVVAERDLTPHAVLVICDDGTCHRRTNVELGEINSGAPVGPLDLALDADDVPAILWGGPDDGPGILRLRLITCDAPRCQS